MPPARLRPVALGASGALWALLPDTHDRTLDHRMLARLAALTTGDETHGLRIAQHCPACGSVDHGRPSAVDARGAVAATVSLGRAGGFVALAASAESGVSIGIDIESVEAVRAAPLDAAFDALELAAFRALTATDAARPAEPAVSTVSTVSTEPTEPTVSAAPTVSTVSTVSTDPTVLADADRRRAVAWAAKEAILKAAGTGLRIDPQSIGLDWPASSAHPVLARSAEPRIHPADVTLVPLAGLPPGLVGMAALLRAEHDADAGAKADTGTGTGTDTDTDAT